MSFELSAQIAADFETEENGDGSLTITRYVGWDTTVVIPARINGKGVTSIGESAFGYQNFYNK